MDWQSAALEEYKTLRSESLGSIEQAQRSVQLGLAGIAAITAFSASGSHKGNAESAIIAVAALLFVTPLVALWAGEVRRAVLAGAHIAGLERRIAKRFEDDADPPMTWETKIQDNFEEKGAFVYDWAVLSTLVAAAVPSATIGFSRLVQHHAGAGLIVAAALLDAGALGFMIVFMRRRHREMTTIHRDAKTP